MGMIKIILVSNKIELEFIQLELELPTRILNLRFLKALSLKPDFVNVIVNNVTDIHDRLNLEIVRCIIN